jgi:hypothetical protein
VGLTAEDRFEIQDLLLRYAAHNGSGESVLFEVFTDDVVLDGPRGHWEGVEGLKGFYEQSGPPEPDERGPMLTNFVVEGDGDEAHMTASILQFKPGEDGERVLSTGWYDCDARRTNGTWKLSRRVTHIDGLPLFKDTAEFARGARWVRRDKRFFLEEPTP